MFKALIFFLTLVCSTMYATFDEFVLFAENQGHNDKHVLQLLYDHFIHGLTAESNPRLIAIGGSPGSGKTTYRKQYLSLSNVHVHDMDEVMIRLPGYQEDLQTRGPKAAFEKWWPIAQKTAQMLVRFAIQSHFSIIYDRTCGSEGSYKDLVQAKEKGYTLHLIGTYVNSDLAKQRVLKRQQEEGRCITEEIVNEYRARFSALWPYYLKLANEAILYDMNGIEPNVIFSSKDGVLNEEIYNKFLKDGEPYQSYFSNIESN
jgi:predicted ABC-type ATPase